jgi:type III secretion system FlhB-like substrate exporter
LARRSRWLPARSVVHAEGEVASKIVIAISWVTNSASAPNDDVCAQGVSSTVGGIWNSASEGAIAIAETALMDDELKYNI